MDDLFVPSSQFLPTFILDDNLRLKDQVRKVAITVNSKDVGSAAILAGCARARTATSEEKPALWRIMTKLWPPFEEYQTRTEREIPVVVLELTA